MRPLSDLRLANATITRALEGLQGQDEQKPRIVDAVLRKLRRPREPLVLHLVGDNGVGKTRTSELISIALSLHCHPQSPECKFGDCMTAIEMTSFPEGKWDVNLTVHHIVRRAAQHAAKFPNGLLVLNDLPAFPREVVKAIGPLLGGAGKFASFPDFDPSKLLVVATSDLGIERRSLRMTPAELTAFVTNEFQWMFPSSDAIITIPFLPIDYASGFRLVAATMQAVKCDPSWPFSIRNVTYDDALVHFILEDQFDSWEVENGRGVMWKLSRMVKEAMRSLSQQHPAAGRVDLHFFFSADSRSIGIEQTAILEGEL